MITLLTPTCDQPIGFALCERWMRRQTVDVETVQWIVIDDGVVPIQPTCGQTYLRRQREPDCSGAQSLCRNLLTALPYVRGSRILCIEHDDYYFPTHLEQMARALNEDTLVGDDELRYYHVGLRLWRVMRNRGAALCQTGFQASVLGTFEQAIQSCLARGRFGVDEALWRLHPGQRRAFRTVVGMKGLPGRPGLGIGHRPHGPWMPDDDGRVLQAWIGADADAYLKLVTETQPIQL